MEARDGGWRRRLGTGGWRQEPGGRRQEVGGWRQKAGDRRLETEDRRLEAGDWPSPPAPPPLAIPENSIPLRFYFHG